jgi:hypothetical protein
VSAVRREAFAEMLRRNRVVRERLAEMDEAIADADLALARLDAAKSALDEAGTALAEQLEHVRALRAIKAVS